MKRKLVKTEDGAHSFYIEELDENYHSVYGAIQESKIVFINGGLNYFKNNHTLNILEIGFGTGLNALMTILHHPKYQEVNYYGVEYYPITSVEARKLNYTEQLNQDVLQTNFMRMHNCNWGNPTPIAPNFILTKILSKIEHYQPKANFFDIIYFDAFAPSAQPQLWTSEVFEKLYKSLKKGGILITYCAKGAVKRALKGVGFKIEPLPGPKNKREITRAIKD